MRIIKLKSLTIALAAAMTMTAVSDLFAADYCRVYFHYEDSSGTSQEKYYDYDRATSSTYQTFKPGSSEYKSTNWPHDKIFTGWYTSSTGGNRVMENSSLPAASTTHLYAHYYDRQSVDLGVALSLPSNLNYTHNNGQNNVGGWFNDSDTLASNVLRSGAIGHNDSAYVYLYLHGRGKFSFYWRLNAASGDSANCQIDGFNVAGGIPSSMQPRSDSFVKFEHIIDSGEDDEKHTITIYYSKNSSGVSGTDSLCIRDFVWEPETCFVNYRFTSDPTVTKYFPVGKPFTGVQNYTYPADRYAFPRPMSASAWGFCGWYNDNATAMVLDSNIVSNRTETFNPHTQKMQAYYTRKIDLSEALDCPDLTFESVGAVEWFGTASESMEANMFDSADGVDAARVDGSIYGGESAILQTSVYGPGVLSFRWREDGNSSFEATDRKDRLCLMVDGSYREFASSEWSEKSINIDVGSHVIKWVFERNQYGYSGGHNTALLDMVKFSSIPPNDNLVDATSLSGSVGGSTGKLTAATTEMFEEPNNYMNASLHKTGVGRTVWYRWTATGNGFCSVGAWVGDLENQGSDFADVVLQVFYSSNGSLNSYSEIATTMSSEGERYRKFQCTSGRTYYFRCDSINESDPTDNLHLSFSFTPIEDIPSYEIRYYDTHNSTIAGTATCYEDVYIYLEVPAALRSSDYYPGYHIDGWARTNGGAKVYEPEEMVYNLAGGGGTVDLCTVWKENSAGYVLHLNRDDLGDDYTIAILAQTGEANIMPDISEFNTLGYGLSKRPGYRFVGWCKYANYDEDVDELYPAGLNNAQPTRIIEVNGDTQNFYAVWQESHYEVTYHVNNDLWYENTEMLMSYGHDERFWIPSPHDIDASWAYPDNRNDAGQYFVSWNTAPDGSSTNFLYDVEATNLIDQDDGHIDLYAQWLDASEIRPEIIDFDIIIAEDHIEISMAVTGLLSDKNYIIKMCQDGLDGEWRDVMSGSETEEGGVRYYTAWIDNYNFTNNEIPKTSLFFKLEAPEW